MVPEKSFLNKIKNDKFLTNSAIFFTGSFLANVGNYIFHFLMARMLPVEGYGELQSLLAIFTIIAIPAGVLSTVLVKYVADFSAKGQLNKVYSLFSLFTKKLLLAAIVFFIAFILLSGYIANFLNLGSTLPVIILGAGLLISFLNSVNTGVIRGLQKFRDISVISIISALFKILLGFLLVKLGFALNGAIGAIVLTGFIGYFITFFPLKFLFGRKKEEIATKEIFRYFFPVFFALLFLSLLYNMDVVLVKHFFSPEIAGQYGALAIIAHIVLFIGGPIVGVMFPMASAAHTNNGNSAKILIKTITLVSLAGLGIVFFYFLFPNFVIKIFVGGKFLSINKFLGWFGLSMLLCSLVGLLSQYFLAIHKTKFIYLLGAGVFLQIILISLFHTSLWQVIWTMNSVMFVTLASLTGYYFKCAKHFKPQESVENF